MNELICLLYIVLMPLIFNFNFMVMSNLMFLILLMMIFQFSWMNWNNVLLNFGLNFYSNGLIVMMIWIFTIILSNLNSVELKNNCVLMNTILMMLVYFIFFSTNMMFFYFMFEDYCLFSM